MRWTRRAIAVLAWAFLWLVGSVAHADMSVAELAANLKGSDDARVRTQAALALGASNDEAAVKPLCDALGDANPSVRVASAAALGKLAKQSGLACLQAASPKESSASVKSQIDKSIATLQGSSGSSGPPPPGPNTKYYVAIQVTNKTTRPSADIEKLIRSAMTTKILGKSTYAIAPSAETAAQGGQIVKSKKLKGFFLIATVEAASYSGSDLTQVVRVSMWTYPDKALQGEFSPKLTQSDTPKQDTESENALMKMCVENAIESFQKVVASL